jgi:hypothetical protein
MPKYTVYFELFTKKMKTEVIAANEHEAKEIIRNKIIFHKVENTNDILNNLMNIFRL